MSYTDTAFDMSAMPWEFEFTADDWQLFTICEQREQVAQQLNAALDLVAALHALGGEIPELVAAMYRVMSSVAQNCGATDSEPRDFCLNQLSRITGESHGILWDQWEAA